MMMMMMKVTYHRLGKIFPLIWILLECQFLSGNIFGFASLFDVLFRYGIYQSRCEVLFEENIANETMKVTKDCRQQLVEFELAFALGLGFYHLPAVVLSMIEHFFGAKALKIIGIVFHLIGWISLANVSAGSDYLILSHAVFSSLSGFCILISSFSLLNYLTQNRGLVAALISGAQISSSIWYSIFQIFIDQQWLTLSTLSWIWVSLALMMFASALFCHRCTSVCSDTRTEGRTDDNPSAQDSLAKHLTNPLFVLLTLFFSCLLLTVTFLALVWFSWLMHLTDNDGQFVNLMTIVFNLSTIFSLFIAPLCGYMIEYRSYRGFTQKIFNLCLIQTLTWLLSIVLCLLSMFQSSITAMAAMAVLILCRTLLVSSCQAVIVMIFPLRYVSTLLGIMWTMAGMVSFVCYGLTRFAVDPINAWRAWLVLLSLCIFLVAYVVYLWTFYFDWKRQHQKQVSINEEEMKCLK